MSDLRAIVFYDKLLVKFERLLETYLAFAPKGLRSFITAMPVWLKEKMLLKNLLQKEIRSLLGEDTGHTEHRPFHLPSIMKPMPPRHFTPRRTKSLGCCV